MDKSIKRKVVIGVVSLLIFILLVTLIFILSSKENVVGEALRTASKTLQRPIAIDSSRTTTAPLQVGRIIPTPQVFNTPFYQSPVRADPDDLLLIPGYGFEAGVVAVYRAVSDKPVNLQAPSNVPVSNTAQGGKLYVADITNDSIAVLLPEVMKTKQTYALWVKNVNGAWSEPVLINDPRPLWITPDITYATKPFASLAREIKVVGRNLEGSVTAKVRLSGSANYDLNVVDDNNPATTIEDYAAKAVLPIKLQPGIYKVQFSRDGITWIDLPTEITFTVLPDPAQKKSFDISFIAYGGCTANDGKDDTGCIVQAIAAAKLAGGGEVFFPAGTWELKNPSKLPDLQGDDGIIVPQKVDLIGVGADGNNPSKIVQTLDWKSSSSGYNMLSVFTLLGNNTVHGLYFHSDGFVPDPNSNEVWPSIGPSTNTIYLALGIYGVPGETKKVIENVVISDNKFSGLNNGKVTGMYEAIGHWGSPLSHLFIVNNEFQAYMTSLYLFGEPYLKEVRPYIKNSVITKNIFYSGAYTKGVTGDGAIAALMYGFQYSDFSDNFADGSVNGGWRAGLWWTLLNNNGPMLVSGNKVTCPGNKGGDGESIAIEDNGNRPGFSKPEKAVAATLTTVSVKGEWAKTLCGKVEVDQSCSSWKEEPIYDGYGYWVHVVDGKGLGQSRKVVSYTLNAPQVITVSPAWDVIPDSTSVINLRRSTWNAYLVDNIVDNRGCNNVLTNPLMKAGAFSFTSMTTDSVMEGNQLFETNGIMLVTTGQEQYEGVFNGWHIFASEVRNNLVDGENKCPPNPPSSYNLIIAGCITGGIDLWYTPTAINTPGVVSLYNNLISHNTVKKADDWGGGIAIRPAGGVSKITPRIVFGNLLFQNTIENSPTNGIGIINNLVWNTILYKNNFKDNKGIDIYDLGTNTVIVNLYCGDGQVTGSEVCDDGLQGKCAYGLKSCQVCSAQCTGLVSGKTSYCGDSVCDVKNESTANCQQDCGNACLLDKMISWWSAEGNAKDMLEKNNGIPIGNAAFTAGKVGQAFSFTSSSDMINIGDPADGSLNLGTDDFTIAFWGKIKGDGIIISKGCPSCSGGLGYSIDVAGTVLVFRLDGEPDQGDSVINYISFILTPADWHHYAGVFDRDGLLTMYIDGKAIGTSDISPQKGTLDNTIPLLIGGANSDIDEIAIWRRTVSAIEISALYNSDSKGMCKI